jgi:hypothetical protein
MSQRHCERSEAIHLPYLLHDGLLRCARNDGAGGLKFKSETHPKLVIAGLDPAIHQSS